MKPDNRGISARTLPTHWWGMVLLFLLTIAAKPAIGQPLPSGISRAQVEQRTYLSYAVESIDNLMTFGTDRYGSTQSDLLVSNLDVRTKNNPPAADLGAADEVWRVERRQRRAPGGSNFLHNQSIYRAMLRAGEATLDNKYSNFVDSNLSWAMTNLVDGNGMFWWGYHRHYDVHTDQMVGDGSPAPHEMHFVDVPLWEEMWNLNPTAVQTEIEGIWERHVVDKTTGQINRHDVPGGLSFITASASFIDAFAFLSTKLPGAEGATWAGRARTLALYNWNDRDPNTNLLAHTPNESTRWDGLRSVTTTPGVYVPALLQAFEQTGDDGFRDQALTYLTSWADYAYDADSGSFWGSLELDGTPVEGPWAIGGYAQYEPRGLIDLWAPEFITAQYNPDAAKAYAEAYVALGDPALLTTAERFAALIRNELPATQTLTSTWYAGYSNSWAPFGTYAEHYGNLIDFFVTLYDATGDDHYLFSARDLAKEAVSTLWYEGLFRGHPNKPYYEAIDGVGLLVESLIDLDARSDDFTKFGDFDGNGQVDTTDFDIMMTNWLLQVTPYEDGDVTGDGFVSLADFSRFKNEYYEGASPLIPEPTGLSLSIIAVGWLVSSRRRRRPPRASRHR